MNRGLLAPFLLYCSFVPRREPLLFKIMAILDHTVEQMITATSYSRFEGLERLSFRVVLPD